MTESWLSLVPPGVAIGLSLLTRKVLPALGAAIVLGALIAGEFSPLQAIVRLSTYAISVVSGASHLGILAFSLLLGVLIGVMQKSGEQERLARLATRFATTPRRGQVATWALGLAIFFDDYVNSLLVGSALRPVYDRLRLSREKLAFLVDATAAPVVSLALVSSWIAVEIGYINEQYEALGLRADGLVVFVQTLPYRFYPWLMLVFGLGIAVTGRDFGPMFDAELAAARSQTEKKTEAADDPTSQVSSQPPSDTGSQLAALPIVVLLFVALAGMWLDGALLARQDGVEPTLRNVFGRSRSHVVLVAAAFNGAVVAICLARFVRRRSLRLIATDSKKGAARMLMPCGILLLAWSLSDVCRDLSTAKYLIGAVGAGIPAPALPAAIFVLSAVTSFATGTSWGTMAILFPLVVPLAHGISSGSEEIMLGSISSILAGSVWGDHCSPISDTTIMSSLSSGCDHVSHVKTQLPYALVVGAVSLVCGDLATGLGLLSPWSALILGATFLLLFIRFFGQKVREPQSS